MFVLIHGGLQVAIKVLRGGSSSRPDFREQLIKVYFLISRVMQILSARARSFAGKAFNG